MRGSPEARCANLLYSCGSGEPYRSKQCGLEVGKVKAKRPISTGFEPFLLENRGICWFLLVFLAMRRARLCPRPRISHKSYAHRGVVFSHRTESTRVLREQSYSSMASKRCLRWHSRAPGVGNS